MNILYVNAYNSKAVTTNKYEDKFKYFNELKDFTKKVRLLDLLSIEM